MTANLRIGGVIHTYQKYDPQRFPSPTQPPRRATRAVANRGEGECPRTRPVHNRLSRRTSVR